MRSEVPPTPSVRQGIGANNYQCDPCKFDAKIICTSISHLPELTSYTAHVKIAIDGADEMRFRVVFQGTTKKNKH